MPASSLTRPALACLSLPAFALQVLLKDSPELKTLPVVIVDDEKPHAPVTWANTRAVRAGIARGMRVDHARSLTGELHVAQVGPEARQAALLALTDALHKATPRVEVDATIEGLLWLDASGTDTLFGTPDAWAAHVMDLVKDAQFTGCLVVGAHREDAFALARSERGTHVFHAPDDAARRAERVPLGRLELPLGFQRELEALGLRTLGHLRRLPARGLGTRFGPALKHLVDLLSGRAAPPLSPTMVTHAVTRAFEVDPPDQNAHRLLFYIKRALHPALEAVSARHEAAARLSFTCILDVTSSAIDEERPALLSTPSTDGTPSGPTQTFDVTPAAPTLDAAVLLELIRLKLAATPLESPVKHVHLHIASVQAERAQHTLFRMEPTHTAAARDLDAAARALARLRATFGAAAVTHAELRRGWLPEASFAWVPTHQPRPPRPTPRASTRAVRAPLARNCLPRPIPLGAPPHAVNTWLTAPARGHPRTAENSDLLSSEHVGNVLHQMPLGPPAAANRGLPHPWRLPKLGMVTAVSPVSRTQGGWWSRPTRAGGLRRHYRWLTLDSGLALWVFHDVTRDRWRLHGWLS